MTEQFTITGTIDHSSTSENAEETLKAALARGIESVAVGTLTVEDVSVEIG